MPVMNGNVNICRPGYGASCSLCCGSHNYRASREECEALFVRRAMIRKAYSRDFLVRKMNACRSAMTGSYYIDPSNALFDISIPAIFPDCPRCPFVGFISRERITRCLLGPEEGQPGLRHECFLNYRGKIFTCTAREGLADEEVLYAARLARDWFYYSILIHEPDLLRRTMKNFPVPEKLQPAQRENLWEELEERIAARRDLHAVHGYFS
ncbi:MAG TPA: hypothetical protein PLM53_03640 [Spirochaetota bacterium]|nr:hypothetical protein [Spirochaetota bacterium]HQH96169.1 hypothetical protein [Spirochaetota bacterium]